MSGSAEAFSGASITEEQSLRGDTHEDAPSQPFQRPLTRLQKRKRQQDSRIDETQSAEEHKVDREDSRSCSDDDSDGSINLAFSLYVQWRTHSGKTRSERASLQPVDSLADLQGLSRTLMERAFPPEDCPDYITSDEYVRFTPVEDLMSLPGDISQTTFRLVISHDGWEYTILEREMGLLSDAARSMLITMIEFESSAIIAGHVGLRMSLIAYPYLCVKKAFILNVAKELRDNPNFKGIL